MHKTQKEAYDKRCLHLHSLIMLSLAFQLQALCCCLRALLLDDLLAPLPLHTLQLRRQTACTRAYARVTLGPEPVRVLGCLTSKLLVLRVVCCVVCCVATLCFRVAPLSRVRACGGGGGAAVATS